MGKGSYSGIEISPLTWELMRLQEIRQARIDKLHSMGYDVCQIDGEWYYRSHVYDDTDHRWTRMDNPDYEPPIISKDFQK